MFGKKRLLQDNEALLKENKTLRNHILSLTAKYDAAEKKIKELQQSPYKPAIGITSEELNICINAIDDLIAEAGEDHKKPTERVKGLAAARSVIEQFTPHEMN